jgi:hypothetical protein
MPSGLRAAGAVLLKTSNLAAALGLTPLKRSHYTGAGFEPKTGATGDLNAAD